jgi:hypothetical protein
MKRACILLTALLALASVCLGQSAPTNQPDSPHIKPPTAAPAAPANPGNTPAAAGLEETLIAREKEVWEKIKKKDMQGFAAYLAEDQLYVGNRGVHSKADTLKSASEGVITELTLDEWKVLPINKDTALVTYRVRAKGTANGQDVASVTRESTVWARRDGKWLAVFHQDTMVLAVE